MRKSTKMSKIWEKMVDPMPFKYTSHDLGQHIHVLRLWLHATNCHSCATDIVN